MVRLGKELAVAKGMNENQIEGAWLRRWFASSRDRSVGGAEHKKWFGVCQEINQKLEKSQVSLKPDSYM